MYKASKEKAEYINFIIASELPMTMDDRRFTTNHGYYSVAHFNDGGHDYEMWERLRKPGMRARVAREIKECLVKDYKWDPEAFDLTIGRYCSCYPLMECVSIVLHRDINKLGDIYRREHKVQPVKPGRGGKTTA